MRWRFFINEFLLLLVAIALTIACARLSRHFHYQIDFSENRVFSLAPISVEVIKQFKKTPLTFIGFYHPHQRQHFHRIVAAYNRHCQCIESKLIDPLRAPSQVNAYKIKKSGSIVIQLAHKRIIVAQANEPRLTQVLYALKNPSHIPLILIGDEKNWSTDYKWLAEMLRAMGYRLGTAEIHSIQDPNAVLFVIGKQQGFGNNHERWKLIERHRRRGGKVIILSESPLKYAGFEIRNQTPIKNLGNDPLVNGIGPKHSVFFRNPGTIDHPKVLGKILLKDKKTKQTLALKIDPGLTIIASSTFLGDAYMAHVGNADFLMSLISNGPKVALRFYRQGALYFTPNSFFIGRLLCTVIVPICFLFLAFVIHIRRKRL